MADRWKLSVAFIALLLETGCDPAPGRKATIEKSAADPIVRDVGQLEANVRSVEAEKRIDELERAVGELKLTPEKLNLELLTARVAALEVGQASLATDSKDPTFNDQAADRTALRLPKQSARPACAYPLLNRGRAWQRPLRPKSLRAEIGIEKIKT
jgi:hypothetical protein